MGTCLGVVWISRLWCECGGGREEEQGGYEIKKKSIRFTVQF